MLYNYYNKLKQILTQNNHDLEISSNDQFIRIEPKIQKWDNEQWKEYIQNIEFQYMDQQLVLQQLKSNFDYSLRPLIYSWIANRTVSLQTDYKILAQTPCSQDNIIFRDIERTHSGLDFYKSKRKSSKKNIQRASQQLESVKSVIDDKMLSDLFSLNQKRLFYLLRAYANIDPETGYVQGMNYIMGLLLYLLDDGNSLYEAEAKAFQTFLHIHLKLNWSKTYNKSMKKVKALIQHFEYLLETNLQDVYKIIKGSGQPFHFFLDSYFFGLMTYRTPIEFSAKIIDIFIVQGEQIIFDVLLRVFILNRQTIKSINDKDELTQFLKDILVSSIEKYGIQALIPNSEIII